MRPMNPDILVLQGSSYFLYADWDDPVACGGKAFDKAPEMYDDKARRRQRQNPETFSVEHLGQWADVQANYLSPALIRLVFSPIDLPDGGERVLQEAQRGFLNQFYRCHIDSSKSLAGFAAMVAHPEVITDPGTGESWIYVIVDRIMRWDPAEFDEHLVDYMQVESELLDVLSKFKTLESVTFDQYGSFAVRSVMKMDLASVGLGHVRVHEVPFNEKANRMRWENFKDAAAMGWARSYRDDMWPGDESNSYLEVELRFLQDVRGKVGAPESGTCTTDDVATCFAELVSQILGDQLGNMDLKERLSVRPAFGAPGGYSTRHDTLPSGQPGAGTRKGRPSNTRDRLEAWSRHQAQQRGGMPPGWTRGLSRWGRRWF